MEKTKGKSNPFASYMRPTEDILWQSKQVIDPWETLFPGVNRTLLMIVAIVIIGVIVGAVVLTLVTRQAIYLSSLGTFILVLLLVWLRMVFRGHIPLVPTLGDHAVYAITSERLLFQRGNVIRDLSIEKVPLINVLPGTKTHGTLSFGATFPMWNGVENAEQVKTIIEKAQKERLKAKQS